MIRAAHCAERLWRRRRAAARCCGHSAQACHTPGPHLSHCAGAGGKSVYALDFDGVVCDSCGESSLSAWKVGRLSFWWQRRAACSVWRVFGLGMGSNFSRSCCELMQAASKVWPDVFGAAEAEARKGELVEKMRAVRPVVETG